MTRNRALEGGRAGGWAFVGLLMLVLSSGVFGQDQPAARHSSPDPRKCKRCLPAYEKALAYVRKNLAGATFPAKMVCGWVFLADGRYPNELQSIIKEACAWESRRGKNDHAQNWYPALAGMLLVEYYKYYPTVEVHNTINALIAHWVKNQERTGGWFKWFEGAYRDRTDYAVKDLGIIDAIVFGFLWNCKALGFKVPEGTMERAEKCIDAICGGSGISYGTGSRGGDKTGARGAFALLGLDYAGAYNHKVYKTYKMLLPKQIPNMDQGHHVGAFHCLGVTLGCHLLGPQAYNKLVAEWLDKYIDKQDSDGGVYIGDDGDAGGEKGLLRGNIGSTGAFALMILLQDHRILRPPPGKKIQPKADEGKGQSRGD